MQARIFELVRYVINGVAATSVHFTILTTLIEIVHLRLVALATLIAASCAICTSFLGNRYFVFSAAREQFGTQALKFLVLAGALAILNASFMFAWSDVYRLNYRYGFLLATCMQFMLSYLGGKFLVFRRARLA